MSTLKIIKRDYCSLEELYYKLHDSGNKYLKNTNIFEEEIFHKSIDLVELNNEKYICYVRKVKVPSFLKDKGAHFYVAITIFKFNNLREYTSNLYSYANSDKYYNNELEWKT